MPEARKPQGSETMTSTKTRATTITEHEMEQFDRPVLMSSG